MLLFFFFNDTATTEIYTLSLHDALPICVDDGIEPDAFGVDGLDDLVEPMLLEDRKSTRLNSSHVRISYAVFCLKKKNHLEDVPAEAALARCRGIYHLRCSPAAAHGVPAD